MHYKTLQLILLILLLQQWQSNQVIQSNQYLLIVVNSVLILTEERLLKNTTNIFKYQEEKHFTIVSGYIRQTIVTFHHCLWPYFFEASIIKPIMHLSENEFSQEEEEKKINIFAVCILSSGRWWFLLCILLIFLLIHIVVSGDGNRSFTYSISIQCISILG